MHFVGILAVNLPVTISYDVLFTLVSALISVGAALSLVTIGTLSKVKLFAGGTSMGIGIVTMHYVGMVAIRANCVISYTPWLVIASIVIAILASMASLWIALYLQREMAKGCVRCSVGSGNLRYALHCHGGCDIYACRCLA